jgi:hypothetical protein
MRKPSAVITFLLAGLATSIGASGEDLVVYRDSSLTWITAKNSPEVAFGEARKLLNAGFMDPQARAVLGAAEVFTREVFNVPTLQFRRAVTYRDATGDNLVAEWATSEPFGVGSVILKDTPYLSVYHLALSHCRIASRADLTSFLTTLLASGKSPIPLWPGALTVDLQASAPRIDQFHVGSPPFSPYRIVRDFVLLGQRDGEEWYVTVTIGKDFTYQEREAEDDKDQNGPPGPYPVPPFVPERFPSLAELAKGWSGDRILREVGKPAGPSPEFDFSDRRDEILIAELVKRGLSVDQFLDLVKSDSLHPDLRLTTALYALRRAGVSLDPYIKSALAMYLPLGAGEEVATLFNYAAEPCKVPIRSHREKATPSPEFEALALKLIKSGQSTEGPLAYLESCSNSRETLDALSSAAVPDSAATAKERAMGRIRRRLPKKAE